MRRNRLIAAAALITLCVIGAIAFSPYLSGRSVAWSIGLREIPLAGARISCRDIGTGSPAIIILSGVAVQKDSYLDLQRRLSSITRVISYDRPGIGASSSNRDPRTLDVIDRDLKALLVALDVPPPYVLLGHSYGGFIARTYAARHPGEVAGLVFLDQPHEDWFGYIRRTWPREEAEEYFKSWSPANKEHSGAALEEILSYEANSRSILGQALPADVPVLMFTTSNPGHFRRSAGKDEDQKKWVEMQTSLLTGVRDYRHLVDTSLSHWPHWDRPEWVAGEIQAFIEKIRKAGPRPGAVSRQSQ